MYVLNERANLVGCLALTVCTTLVFHTCAEGIQGIPFLGDIPINYWADSPTLAFTMLVAMGFAETARYLVRRAKV
jgi:hypothetical protein